MQLGGMQPHFMRMSAEFWYQKQGLMNIYYKIRQFGIYCGSGNVRAIIHLKASGSKMKQL